MNAAFLIMSSAALAGADPAPPQPPPAAPIVVSGAGCSNCGAPAYSSGCCGSSRVGFLDRIKGRMGGCGHKSHDCGCAPAPACAPAPCCTSVANRPNLFDTLKSRWGSKKHSCCETSCGPTCDPCGANYLVAPPNTGGSGGTPPKEMPKPKDKEKGGNTSSIPQSQPPVSGAGLSGNSPY